MDFFGLGVNEKLVKGCFWPFSEKLVNNCSLVVHWPFTGRSLAIHWSFTGHSLAIHWSFTGQWISHFWPFWPWKWPWRSFLTTNLKPMASLPNVDTFSGVRIIAKCSFGDSVRLGLGLRRRREHAVPRPAVKIMKYHQIRVRTLF